jgi:hypothetical protein
MDDIGYVVASFAFNTETNIDAVKEVLVQPNFALMVSSKFCSQYS